ncbi:hypothetical protein EMIT0P44_70045 [Pseudomonas sp. IT-P44]
MAERREIDVGARRAHVLQVRILVRTQFQAQRSLALALVTHHQPFELLAQEHRRHFQVQQFVGVRRVHQQVNPFVLTNGQARHREIEPPDVAVTVQFGEMAVVDAKHSTAEFLVSAGNGLLFIEFHNIPTGLDLQGRGLNTLRILGGWSANIKPNLHGTMKCRFCVSLNLHTEIVSKSPSRLL